MSIDHYTYRVTWSQEDGEHVGLCAEFPSLSWLAATPEAALVGIRKTVTGVVADMKRNMFNYAIAWAEDGVFHFHRFHDDEWLAFFNFIACRHHEFYDAPRHHRGEAAFVGSAILCGQIRIKLAEQQPSCVRDNFNMLT